MDLSEAGDILTEGICLGLAPSGPRVPGTYHSHACAPRFTLRTWRGLLVLTCWPLTSPTTWSAKGYVWGSWGGWVTEQRCRPRHSSPGVVKEGAGTQSRPGSRGSLCQRCLPPGARRCHSVKPTRPLGKLCSWLRLKGSPSTSCRCRSYRPSGAAPLLLPLLPPRGRGWVA